MIPRTLVKRPKSSVGNLEEFFLENLSSPRRRTWIYLHKTFLTAQSNHPIVKIMDDKKAASMQRIPFARNWTWFLSIFPWSFVEETCCSVCQKVTAKTDCENLNSIPCTKISRSIKRSCQTLTCSLDICRKPLLFKWLSRHMETDRNHVTK